MTNKGERFCFHIPEEGAEYVHNNMKENEFIKDLIELISHHGCKMEDIFELFRQHSDQITIEEMHSDEFDYMICFENDPVRLTPAWKPMVLPIGRTEAASGGNSPR